LFGPAFSVGRERGDLRQLLVRGLEVLRWNRAALFEQSRQLPVDDEVRIAADGRREVAVVGGSQRIVAPALLAVERLALRPQKQVREQALLGLPFDPLQDFLEGGGRDS
jgi:hypothetical protein